MTQDELQKLKALARAATPRPWVNDIYGNIKPQKLNQWRDNIYLNGVTLSINQEAKANTAFVTQANPSAILAMIERIESLTADAERYQLLRKNALMGYPSCEGSNRKDAYLVITGYGWDDNEKIVDEAVDAAIATGEKKS